MAMDGVSGLVSTGSLSTTKNFMNRFFGITGTPSSLKTAGSITASRGFLANGIITPTAGGTTSYNSNGITMNGLGIFSVNAAGYGFYMLFQQNAGAAPNVACLSYPSNIATWCIQNGGSMGWSSNPSNSVGDTYLTRPAVGTVQINNNSSGIFGALICGQPTTSTVGITVQGIASGTANLQNWQNSSGTVLASVNASGVGTFGNANTKYLAASAILSAVA